MFIFIDNWIFQSWLLRKLIHGICWGHVHYCSLLPKMISNSQLWVNIKIVSIPGFNLRDATWSLGTVFFNSPSGNSNVWPGLRTMKNHQELWPQSLMLSSSLMGLSPLVSSYKKQLTHPWKLVCRYTHFLNFLACFEIIQHILSLSPIAYNQSRDSLVSSPAVMRVFLFYFSWRDIGQVLLIQAFWIHGIR